MTTCLGKSCSFGLPRMPFINCCQFMYLVISLLVLRAGCGIWLYQFLIIAYLFTFHMLIYMWSRMNIIFTIFPIVHGYIEASMLYTERTLHNLSHVMRKPVYAICEQQKAQSLPWSKTPKTCFLVTRLISLRLYMSRLMTKPTKWHVRPAKNQPGHPPSLIRFFAVRSMGS